VYISNISASLSFVLELCSVFLEFERAVKH